MTEARDRRWQLFAAQTTLLGLYCGLLVIPSSAVFLGRFGAENMPWTYIAVAVGAMIGTPSLARGVRRRTLAVLGVPIWVALGAAALAGWIGLEWFDARWVSAPLFVLFPLSITIGFFFVGGQAGRVFDLREMKEQFPRVVLGFAVGFLLSSLGGDALIALLDDVGRLLPFAAASGFGVAVLIALAERRYPDSLGPASLRAAEAAGDAPTRVPLRRLLANRYVAMLLAYQMLSQLGSQLADFLMFERSAARFTDERELGTFIARYTTGLNILDLIFLLLVAGFLLRKFGMRVGLSVNPLVVTVLMVGAIAAAAVSGIGSWGAFVFILSARAFDIAFTDGATRTALNTAYQAVPTSEQLSVQATIEGLGVPIALGLTGVILLVLQQALGVGATGIAVLTVGVGVVWTAAGVAVFRSYRAALRRGLEQRLLSPAALDLDDPATRAELDRMLASGDDREVWIALGALGAHPERADRLVALASSPNARVAEVAYRQLRTDDPGRALAIAPSLRTGSPSAPVRYAALGMLARNGDADARHALESALDDPDRDARLAARRAAAGSGDAGLLAQVADRSRGGADPATAAAALPVAGEALVGLVADALLGGDARYAIRLVRLLPPSTEVVAALAEHVDHADRDVAVAVRQAVARAGSGPALAGRIDGLLQTDASTAACILAAMSALPRDRRVDVLHRSLADELDLTATSVLATLSLAIDPAFVGHAQRGLRSRDERVVAQAVETVELHLDQRRGRWCIPILDRRLSPPVRLAALRAVADVPTFDADGALTYLADGGGTWCRPWLRACAADTRAALAI